jgi:DNA polymerase IV
MSRSQLHRPDSPDRGAGDDTGCPVLHVDMDAFYASVSLLARPDLRGTPVIVGGANRGVVLSATYEARKYGVHSAMPMTRARRTCPQATVLEPDHAAYARVSAGVMEIFRSVTPFVEPLALDEAFLDVSGAVRRLGSPTEIGELLRARVHDEQGVTCSVGVASTKFVAKLASTRAKPDGLLVVPRDRVVEFLHPLPVGALWGVGERTDDQLRRLGLRTVGDLAGTPVATLERALGRAAGRHLSDLAWGRDPRSVVPHEPDKSVGAEETFGTDVDDAEVVRRELLRLSGRVASRMRAQGVRGRTVSIKVRFADFTTITRSRTLRDPTDITRDVYSVARGLFDALGLDRARLRLVGVRVEGLVDVEKAEEQLLLDAPEHGWRDADQAVDNVSRRFGHGLVRPAALVPQDRPAPPRTAPSRRPRGGSDRPAVDGDTDL